MTVFIAHAPADQDAAEALEKFIERRGQFAELDDGQTAMRPVQPNDVVVLLISQSSSCSRLHGFGSSSAALDAWAAKAGSCAVKLDHGHRARLACAICHSSTRASKRSASSNGKTSPTQIRESSCKTPPAYAHAAAIIGGPAPPIGTTTSGISKKIDAARETAEGAERDAEVVRKQAHPKLRARISFVRVPSC